MAAKEEKRGLSPALFYTRLASPSIHQRGGSFQCDGWPGRAGVTGREGTSGPGSKLKLGSERYSAIAFQMRFSQFT